jgi:hypothetical protein
MPEVSSLRVAFLGLRFQSPLARAAIGRVLGFALAGLDLRMLLKALRGYLRTSLLRRPAASAH